MRDLAVRVAAALPDVRIPRIFTGGADRRTGDDLDTHSKLHGIQSWMALPIEQEEMEPAFVRYAAEAPPELTIEGATVRVIIGKAHGQRSPVTTYSPMLYLEVCLPKGSALALPSANKELAAYIVSGEVRIDEQSYTSGVMAVACAGATVRLEALADSRVMVIGGDPLGKRFIWWNFVCSSRERIEQGKADWKGGRFDPVPGDSEFIPLPE